MKKLKELLIKIIRTTFGTFMLGFIIVTIVYYLLTGDFIMEIFNGYEFNKTTFKSWDF